MADRLQTEWGFYGRASEQAEIERIVSSGRWFFCAISGRRRIGKTTLIQQALRSRDDLSVFYFQVPDSDERGVVQVFQDALEDYGVSLDLVRDTARTFADMAELIDLLCRDGWIIVIDEFQYFHRKQLSPFASFLQARVDQLRDTRSGGLFVLGSIHTEMTAILDDQASPLFNRLTHRIRVEHWDFSTLFEMFRAHGVADRNQQLFLWSMFEGVPKFYRDAFDQGVLAPAADHRRQTLRKLFFEGSSPLRDEAANWFLRELRGRYDSVLKLLASKGPCPYRELVAEYSRAGSGDEKQLSAYLTTLIDKYQMVEKLQPVFAPRAGRKARYVISDNFLGAWLKALARNVQMSRIQPVEKCVDKAETSLQSFEGFAFEKIVRLLIQECSKKSVGDFHLSDFVRGYWNKADGSDIEIDIVACNEDDRRVRLGSCKRSSSQHDRDALLRFDDHASRFLRTKEGRRFSGWAVEKALYAPVFRDDERNRLLGLGYLCRDLRDFETFLKTETLPLFERSTGARAS